MSRSPVTLLWAVDSDIDVDLADRLDDLGVSLRHTDERQLHAAVLDATRSGAVLAVVGSTTRSNEALRAGADEVLLSDELGAVDQAADRAKLRSNARRRRETHIVERLRLDDASAIELFASAVGSRAEQALGGLSARCEALDETLSVRIEGESGGSTRTGFRSTIREISEGVDHAARLVRQLRGFLSADGVDETDLRVVAWEVAALVRPAVEEVADFDVALSDAECTVAMPRWQLVQALGALLRNAVTRVARRGGDRRQIRLGLYRQEHDIAVFEVSDDGVETDLDPDSIHLDPIRVVSRSGDVGLAVLVARIRQAGGELIVDTEQDHGTSVRVFLPVVAKPERGTSHPRRLRSVS